MAQFGQPSGRDGADRSQSIIAFVGTVFIVLSLSEIASVYPTAGGMGPIQNPSLFIATPAVLISFLVSGFTSPNDIPVFVTHSQRLRTISLGPLPDPSIVPSHSGLVYGLDLHRRPACAHRICGLCRWAAVASPHHSKQSRLIHPGKMAGNAVLLARHRVFDCDQYLGVEDLAALKHRRW